LWTFNDSGNPPELFATDTLGRDRGVFLVEGARNQDWEAIALGRCGATDCLFIGDVGDNVERRSSVTVYRVREPQLPERSADTRLRPNATLQLRYPDGAHNVEAMLAAPDQSLYLITKKEADGARVYRVPGAAWADTGQVVTASFVQALPIPTRNGLAFLVTDATLAADSVSVALRTYRYIYFFSLRDDRLIEDTTRPRCDGIGLDVQGEGVAWLADGRLVTTSERIMTLGGTIAVIACPRS